MEVISIDKSLISKENLDSALQDINKNINVYSLATPKLVPMIENNLDTKLVLDEYLKPYKDIDSIILGCTHYKLIEDNIKNITIINSSDGVVDEIGKYIKNEGNSTFFEKKSLKNLVGSEKYSTFATAFRGTLL